MFARRVQRELRVKCNDLVDLFHRDAETFGDLRLHLNGQVPVELLRLLKHRHQRARNVLMIGNDL